MYTKKQKIEIFLVFLLIAFTVELFTVFIGAKEIFRFYKSQNGSLPWELPIKALILLWTFLYALIGVSGALLWIKPITQIRNFALWAWVIQLSLNLCLPVCFLYIPIPVLTPTIITLLFMTLIILMFYSFMVSRLSAILIIPYFIVVIYKMLFHWIFYILNLDLP